MNNKAAIRNAVDLEPQGEDDESVYAFFIIDAAE